MRKIQVNSGLIEKTISAIGDSQTAIDSPANYGFPSFYAWTVRLSERLNLMGGRFQSRTFGVGGYTTADVLGIAQQLFRYDTPEIGIVYAGVNDPGSGISGTATAGAANSITLQNTVNARVNSYVGNVISITSGTGSGQSKTIIGFNPATLVATLDSNFVTIPNATSVYTIAAPTTAQTQANIQALIKVLKYGVRGSGIIGEAVHVWNQSELPAMGQIGQRYVVMQDNSINGGLKPNHLVMNPTIAANYSASPRQSVWEFRTVSSGESGWGRVAIAGTPAFSDGCAKIINMGSNYLNWPTGGDNYNVSTETGTQYAPYIPVRLAAKNAAIAEGTVYCDLYRFQSLLVYGGDFLGNTINPETTQGSGSFHYIPTNQHYSPYGYDTVARPLVYQIQHEGWV